MYNNSSYLRKGFNIDLGCGFEIRAYNSSIQIVYVHPLVINVKKNRTRIIDEIKREHRVEQCKDVIN